MTNEKQNTKPDNTNGQKNDKTKEPEKEIGGFKDAGLPEPTRYNDWEVKGRCSDF